MILLVLSFAIRVYRLGATEFWFDEAATYVFAIKGFIGNLEFARVSPSEHPPLYYWIMDAWMQLSGSTEFTIRFLSLWLGLLVVVLIYRLARRELGQTIALGVLVGATFSPFLVTYSQEARMYTLLLVWTVLALELFLAIVRYGRPRDIVLFAVISMLGMATHYFFALTFIGEFIFFVLQGRSLNRRAALQWLFLMLVPGTAILVWAALSPGVRVKLIEVVVGGPWVPAWQDRLTQIVKDMAWLENFGTSLDTPARLFAVIGWVPLFFGLVFSDDSRPNVVEFRRLLASIVAGTFLTIALLQQGVVGRHVAVMYPSFLVLSLLGIAELYKRGKTHGALAVILVATLFALGLYTQYTDDKGDLGIAFKSIERKLELGDAIVSAQPSSWPLVDYYHRHSAVPIIYFPEKPLAAVVDKPPLDPEPEEVIRFLAPIRAAHRRIWLEATGARTNDPGQVMPRWLSETAFAAEVIYERSTSFELFVTGTVDNQNSIAKADFGNQIHLQSAFINTSTVKAGETILMNLQWTTGARIAADELPLLRMVDTRGHVWAEQRMLPCGGFCLTSDWKTDSLVDDRHGLIVPAGTPPGNYRLTLQLFHPPSGMPLPVKAPRGGLDANTLQLAMISVLPNPLAVFTRVEHSLSAAFGANLMLAGYGAVPPEVSANGSWPVDLLWRAQGPIPGETALIFQWLDERGASVAESIEPITAGDYLVTAWQDGEAIFQHYDVPLPRDTNALNLQLAVQVRQNGELAGRAALLASVHVVHVARSFFAPDATHPVNAIFSNVSVLSGYDLALRPNRRIALTLYWRALEAAQKSYKVFVHLISDDNALLAQNDSEPAAGLRPTTNWIAGEYVKDEHIINLTSQVNPGTYRLEVGLYDPTNGERLLVTNDNAEQENQRLILTTIEVN